MPTDAVWKRTVARAVNSGDAHALPVHFAASVLNRYIDGGARILRTNTVGRLLQPGKAVIDFGIVDEDAVIHLRFGDIGSLIPESERDHWLDHLVPPTASRPYLQMTLQPGACHDDGELREWTPEA
ncbi:MAG: hypothetical protein OXT70_05420 [Chloroflexota bacterium]|nr:hypothetical protein [Chloroflexota bacterium]